MSSSESTTNERILEDNLKKEHLKTRWREKQQRYHSYNYSRKGKLNSYTVSYLENEKSEFGRIEYFFEVNGKFYAYIKKIKISDDLSTTIPKSSGKFYDFVLKQLKNYYKLIQKSQFNIYDIIGCKSIQKKCIIIESEKNEFITEMSYEFEHD